QHPGERQLRRRAVLFPGDGFDAAHEIEVALKIFSLKARVGAAPVVRRQVLLASDGAGEKTAAERAVGDKADAERAHGGQDIFFRLAAPERILRLERRDRM